MAQVSPLCRIQLLSLTKHVEKPGHARRSPETLLGGSWDLASKVISPLSLTTHDPLSTRDPYKSLIEPSKEPFKEPFKVTKSIGSFKKSLNRAVEFGSSGELQRRAGELEHGAPSASEARVRTALWWQCSATHIYIYIYMLDPPHVPTLCA